MKPKPGFVQRQVPARGYRLARGKNELIVRRAIADEDVAIQREAVGAAVGEFEPKDRVR